MQILWPNEKKNLNLKIRYIIKPIYAMRISVLIIILFIQSNLLISQYLSWDFPTKPGTPEWGLLHNQRTKVQACQVPEDILRTIPSEDLIIIYFKYPLLFNVLSFSTFQKGIDDLKRNFNGFSEICSRPDIPSMLLDRYGNMSPAKFDPNWTSLRKGSFAFSIISLELLLSQNEILQNLTYTEKKYLLMNAMMKLDEKSGCIQIHDYIGLKSTCYLMVVLLQEFNKTSQFASPDQIELLKDFSNNYSIQDYDKILQITMLYETIINYL